MSSYRNPKSLSWTSFCRLRAQKETNAFLSYKFSPPALTYLQVQMKNELLLEIHPFEIFKTSLVFVLQIIYYTFQRCIFVSSYDVKNSLSEKNILRQLSSLKAQEIHINYREGLKITHWHTGKTLPSVTCSRQGKQLEIYLYLNLNLKKLPIILLRMVSKIF